MDFKELNYVLAIARHQNITKAAEALHLTQPTLSKFLKALETVYRITEHDKGSR